jgi:hypothetical protein
MAFLSHLPRVQVPGFMDQDDDSIVSLWADFVSVRLACHLYPFVGMSDG